MTELSKTNKMTSREIAELTGKPHNDVLKAIRAMESAWRKVTGGNFPLSEYTDVTGRKLPEYSLSKTECLYVATKFNDEARARLVLRWEELERAKMDFSDPNVVLQLAQNWKEEQEKRVLVEAKMLKLAEKIMDDAPKVVFANAVAGSDNSILVRQFAKVLTDEGFKIGQNRLFEWLRDNNYLNGKNEPYQNYMEQGYFEVIERTIGASGQTFTTRTTKITGRGQVYFASKLRQSAAEFNSEVIIPFVT